MKRAYSIFKNNISFGMDKITDKNDIIKIVNENNFVMFSLSTCPFCVKALEFFKKKSLKPVVIEVDKHANSPVIRSSLLQLTGQRTFPNIFAYSNHLGGCDDVLNMDRTDIFDKSMQTYQKRRILHSDTSSFDYEFAVIGGGSGGIACAKELADSNKSVVLFDFVTPSPMGTKWGLGGTCVNVGCIPKKLMHQASLHHENILKSKYYGFGLNKSDSIPSGDVTHDWGRMCENIHNHIKSLNFGARGELMTRNVKYINSLAKIQGKHEIMYYADQDGQPTVIKAKYIILGMGERPQLPDIPGKEHCITSDDLFWLTYPPGKTLVVGASYVALECAGMLHGMGFDVTVLVRSIFLRGYDQEMAEKVGAHLSEIGVKIMRPALPISVKCITPIDHQNNKPAKLLVTYSATDKASGQQVVHEEELNTVLFAIGRNSCTSNIGLETVKIPLDERGRVKAVDNREQTECESVFAIGDILAGKPQLTPVAIKAGQLLARRLTGQSFENCDYSIVPTTVFTPLEYGALGYSEESAISTFGADDIDVYIGAFVPLEETIVADAITSYYHAKLICRTSQNNKVIGLHITCPNAGEVVQGYAVALRMGATLIDFQRTFGIHPTVSEVFTNMRISKKSGIEVKAGGC